MKYPIFRTLITTLVLAFLLLNARTQNAIAQTTRVSGKVFDSETKEPLPFVNIIFKGTRIGTTSDFDGNFLLSTSEKVDSLVF